MAITKMISPADTLARKLGERGLTQAVFAKQLGVTRPYLNGVLKGKYPFNLSLAMKLAEALGGSAENWMSEAREWESYRKSPTGLEELREREEEDILSEFALRGRGYLLGYEVTRAIESGIIKVSHFLQDQLDDRGTYSLRASALQVDGGVVELRRHPLRFMPRERAVVLAAESFGLNPHLRLEFSGLSENLQSAFILTPQAQVLAGGTTMIPLFHAGAVPVDIVEGTDVAMVRFYFDSEIP